MTDFMLLFRGGDARQAGISPEQMQGHMQRWMVWMKDLGDKNQMVSAQPLDGSGKTISGTKMVIGDSPFAKGKEIVNGYLLCKAANIDEALEISKGCPILEFEDGVIEIRPIQQMNM